MTTIWEKIASCGVCTDESPCSEHEAEALELYESEVKTPTWENLMQVAFSIALMSPDPSTQNSAFLVHPDKARSLVPETISVNEFPRNVRVTDERWGRPDKYLYVEHAERNALYNAARYGIATQGLIMVSLWASCADCARAIIQCGITTLVRFKMPPIQSWQMSTDVGDTMFAEAGVKIIEVTDVGQVKPILRNQEMWIPNKDLQ